MDKPHPFKSASGKKFLHFCSHQVAQVPSSENPLLRDRALLFQEHRALGCASIPFPEGCRSSSGVRASSSVAEKGNPREAERPGPTNTIPVPLGKGTNPQSLQQLLPPFPQGIPLLLHFYIHQTERKTGKRFCASSPVPTQQLGASPACSSQCHPCQDTRECQQNLFSSGKTQQFSEI